uniref:Uncharacterized protein n=1 Tax=Acrobeloides nanus TaxID=290746 RepID=A0A914CV78_9BILA
RQQLQQDWYVSSIKLVTEEEDIVIAALQEDGQDQVFFQQSGIISTNIDGNSSDIPKNDIILPAGVVNKALLPRELDSARCATFACLCQRFGGMMKSRPLSECVLRNGEVLSKSIRKEYRMLSDDERIRYHNAVNQLKNSR